jgi:hypothetical protein
MQGADHIGPRNCQHVLGSEVWAKRMKLQLAATGPVSDPSSTRTVPCRVTRVVTDSESESQNPGSAHGDLAQGELGRARRAGFKFYRDPGRASDSAHWLAACATGGDLGRSEYSQRSQAPRPLRPG